MADVGDAYAEIEMRKAREKEDEAPIEREDMEFFGAIVTAGVKQTQWTSQRVEENLQRDAKEWRDAFVELWDSIDRVNQTTVDSMRIDDTLRQTSGWRNRADQPFYWEKENH